jgi:CheY-like chemotaxis protein
MNQIGVEGLLRRDGHNVVLASNGAAALAAIRTGDFDLVLMDMQMPTMNGIHATRAIRESNGRMSGVPIVALTANALGREVEQWSGSRHERPPGQANRSKAIAFGDREVGRRGR